LWDSRDISVSSSKIPGQQFCHSSTSIHIFYQCIKNSTSEDNNNYDKQAIIGPITRTISFDDAVRKAYYLNKEVSHYLGYSPMSTKDPNYKPPKLFDFDSYNLRVWQFRYKIQYEEPNIQVIQEDSLIISWKRQGC
jgi:hypothetical protein